MPCYLPYPNLFFTSSTFPLSTSVLEKARVWGSESVGEIVWPFCLGVLLGHLSRTLSTHPSLVVCGLILGAQRPVLLFSHILPSQKRCLWRLSTLLVLGCTFTWTCAWRIAFELSSLLPWFKGGGTRHSPSWFSCIRSHIARAGLGWGPRSALGSLVHWGVLQMPVGSPWLLDCLLFSTLYFQVFAS